ncbi:MAG: helix-turn-helix domain-containing protein [Patescibacteria group bacterium]
MKSNFESLKNLGLNEKEQEIYLALLQLERASVGRLAVKSGLKRSTIYDILYRLQTAGFVSEVEMHGTKIFIATPPQKLKNFLADRQRELEQDLPYLLSISNSKPMKPKVSYFYGTTGIKQLYDDTLESCKKNDEILAYVTNETAKYLDQYSTDYVVRRVEKGIKIRGIYQDSLEMKKYFKNNKDQLRTARIVDPKKFPMKNEINIYANKMIIITHSPEPFGILIESKEVADTQRTIFEMAWGGI